MLGAEQEILEVADDVAVLPADGHVIASVGDDLGDRLRRIELAAELVEVRDLEIDSEPDGARPGLELAQEETKERRLSDAVVSDETQPVSPAAISSERS